jgi:hypothetical protein
LLEQIVEKNDVQVETLLLASGLLQLYLISAVIASLIGTHTHILLSIQSLWNTSLCHSVITR